MRKGETEVATTSKDEKHLTKGMDAEPLKGWCGLTVGARVEMEDAAILKLCGRERK